MLRLTNQSQVFQRAVMSGPTKSDHVDKSQSSFCFCQPFLGKM